MDTLFEYRLVQNPALAAEAIWYSVAACTSLTEKKSGVPFPTAFLILPAVLHQQTARALATKQSPGALFKALAEDRTIPSGFQHRLESLADLTLDALNIGFASRLLLLHQTQTLEIFPGRTTPPIEHTEDNVKVIIGAAKRIGQAFAELDFPQLCSILDVKF